MPEPELNGQLCDARGRFVGRLDLACPRYRACVEYDGRHHATEVQFTRDADRWGAVAEWERQAQLRPL
jgi:very-short-patch-repair endonuclease